MLLDKIFRHTAFNKASMDTNLDEMFSSNFGKVNPVKVRCLQLVIQVARGCCCGEQAEHVNNSPLGACGDFGLYLIKKLLAL